MQDYLYWKYFFYSISLRLLYVLLFNVEQDNFIIYVTPLPITWWLKKMPTETTDVYCWTIGIDIIFQTIKYDIYCELHKDRKKKKIVNYIKLDDLRY